MIYLIHENVYFPILSGFHRLNTGVICVLILYFNLNNLSVSLGADNTIAQASLDGGS